MSFELTNEVFIFFLLVGGYSCLLLWTGLGGAHGMLSILMSLQRESIKASKGKPNKLFNGLSPI